jgi:hypothetical protein
MNGKSGRPLPNQGGTTECVKPSSLTGGMEAFVLQAAEKAFLKRSQSFEPLDVANVYASGFFLPAALLGKRRVSARKGWAGEKEELFEQLVEWEV